MKTGHVDSPSRKRGLSKRVLIVGVIAIAIAIGAGAFYRFRARGARDEPKHLDLLYAAWNAFDSKQLDTATAILDRRAAVVSPTALDWMLRARIAEAQGRSEAALDHLKQIPDSDPVSAQRWLKTGQIELAMRHARRAEAAFRESLLRNKDQIQPHRELAFLYAAQRRVADCDAQFQALAKLMPLDHVLAFAWCQNFLQIWNTDEAIETLSGFVAADPSDRWSRLALARSLREAHRIDEAETILGPLDDSDHDARALRVELATDRGDVERARSLAREGSADHVRLNTLRGRLALSENNAQKAAGYFRAALRREPDDHDALQGLGSALRASGDPQAAALLNEARQYDEFKRTLQGAINTIHTDPRLFTKLGEQCQAIHRTAQARVWYELAIERDPLDSQAQRGLTLLDEARRDDDDPLAPRSKAQSRIPMH